MKKGKDEFYVNGEPAFWFLNLGILTVGVVVQHSI